MTTSIQQQERERELDHEIRMMHHDSTMVNPGVMQVPQHHTSVTTSQDQQPTYTDISHSSPLTDNYFHNFRFN